MKVKNWKGFAVYGATVYLPKYIPHFRRLPKLGSVMSLHRPHDVQVGYGRTVYFRHAKPDVCTRWKEITGVDSSYQ